MPENIERSKGAEKQRPSLTAEMINTNAILRSLEKVAQSALVDAAEVVELAVRDPIYTAEEEIHHVFFPVDSVLSVVTRMREGGMIEVGTIGREGCSAVPLILGAKTTANDCYCQVPGRAIKLPTPMFFKLRNESPSFRQLLDRFLQAYVNFLGQLAGCNRLHTVYERCSRWLLLTHDRVDRNMIELTHEYLAMMLGSRRSGITIALSTLRKAGFIQYGRGVIEILERAGLEETTCECYWVAQEQFGGLLRSVNGATHET